jgi:D-alanyl-D-alanine carboxypeptidase
MQMKKIAFTLFILVSAFTLPADELSESISQFIKNKPADSIYVIDGEQLFTGKILQEFYQNRNYAPASG